MNYTPGLSTEEPVEMMNELLDAIRGDLTAGSWPECPTCGERRPLVFLPSSPVQGVARPQRAGWQ
jgi:hypothetical protein